MGHRASGSPCGARESKVLPRRLGGGGSGRCSGRGGAGRRGRGRRAGRAGLLSLKKGNSTSQRTCSPLRPQIKSSQGGRSPNLELDSRDGKKQSVCSLLLFCLWMNVFVVYMLLPRQSYSCLSRPLAVHKKIGLLLVHPLRKGDIITFCHFEMII